MIFEPQLTPPTPGDPYYNNIQGGGFNPCRNGNSPRNSKKPTGRTGLNVLPNCTGYCTGRFNAVLQLGRCKWLGNFYAYYMATAAKMQGLKVQKAPVRGGVMCWSGGKSGNGHVASVEIVVNSSTVVTSESEWNGLYFANYTRTKGDGNWRSGCSWMGASYKYIGCIVPPIDQEDLVTQEDFNKCMDNWLEEQKKKPASNYAKPALEWGVENKLIAGDEHGNLMPQSMIKRQDVIVILKRFWEQLVSGL